MKVTIKRKDYEITVEMETENIEALRQAIAFIRELITEGYIE